jgi:hypothetical protein
VAVARQVLTYFEDRRVVYNAYEVEEPEHVVASILDIRRFLTEVLSQGGVSGTLSASLRMVAQLPPVPRPAHLAEGGRITHPRPLSAVRWLPDADPAFNQALGEFRAAVGTQLSHIAAAFGLDVEEPLSSILPAPDQDADTAPPRTPREIIADHGGAVTSNARMSLVTD